MNRGVGFGIGLALLLVLFVGARLALEQRVDDSTAVRQALDEALSASRKGEPGGVLELFSRNLTVNDIDGGWDRRQVADVIRRSKPDFRVLDPNPKVYGDRATIVSDVEVQGFLGPIPLRRRLSKVTLVFGREDALQWFVIPVKRWKLREVRVDASALAGFAG